MQTEVNVTWYRGAEVISVRLANWMLFFYSHKIKWEKQQNNDCDEQMRTISNVECA